MITKHADVTTAMMLGAPAAVLAALAAGRYIAKRRAGSLTNRILAKSMPVLKYLPGAVLGGAIGGYFGNESKKQKDELGLPYNHELEF